MDLASLSSVPSLGAVPQSTKSTKRKPSLPSFSSSTPRALSLSERLYTSGVIAETGKISKSATGGKGKGGIDDILSQLESDLDALKVPDSSDVLGSMGQKKPGKSTQAAGKKKKKDKKKGKEGKTKKKEKQKKSMTKRKKEKGSRTTGKRETKSVEDMLLDGDTETIVKGLTEGLDWIDSVDIENDSSVQEDGDDTISFDLDSDIDLMADDIDLTKMMKKKKKEKQKKKPSIKTKKSLPSETEKNPDVIAELERIRQKIFEDESKEEKEGKDENDWEDEIESEKDDIQDRSSKTNTFSASDIGSKLFVEPDQQMDEMKKVAVDAFSSKSKWSSGLEGKEVEGSSSSSLSSSSPKSRRKVKDGVSLRWKKAGELAKLQAKYGVLSGMGDTSDHMQEEEEHGKEKEVHIEEKGDSEIDEDFDNLDNFDELYGVKFDDVDQSEDQSGEGLEDDDDDDDFGNVVLLPASALRDEEPVTKEDRIEKAKKMAVDGFLSSKKTDTEGNGIHSSSASSMTSQPSVASTRWKNAGELAKMQGKYGIIMGGSSSGDLQTQMTTTEKEKENEITRSKPTPEMTSSVRSKLDGLMNRFGIEESDDDDDDDGGGGGGGKDGGDETLDLLLSTTHYDASSLSSRDGATTGQSILTDELLEDDEEGEKEGRGESRRQALSHPSKIVPTSALRSMIEGNADDVITPQKQPASIFTQHQHSRHASLQSSGSLEKGRGRTERESDELERLRQKYLGGIGRQDEQEDDDSIIERGPIEIQVKESSSSPTPIQSEVALVVDGGKRPIGKDDRTYQHYEDDLEDMDEEIEDDIPDETEIVHAFEKEYQSEDDAKRDSSIQLSHKIGSQYANEGRNVDDDQYDDEYSEDFEELTHDETMLSPSQKSYLKKSSSPSPSHSPSVLVKREQKRSSRTPEKKTYYSKKRDQIATSLPSTPPRVSSKQKGSSKTEEAKLSASHPSEPLIDAWSSMMPPPWMMSALMMPWMMPKPELLSAAATMMTTMQLPGSRPPPPSYNPNPLIGQPSTADIGIMSSVHDPSVLLTSKETFQTEKGRKGEISGQHNDMKSEEKDEQPKPTESGEECVPTFVHDSQSASSAIASNDMFKYYLDSIRHRHESMRQQLVFAESITHKPYQYTRLSDVKNEIRAHRRREKEKRRQERHKRERRRLKEQGRETKSISPTTTESENDM